MTKVIKNAIIDRCDVGIEDHGMLTLFIDFDYGDGSHQGLPLYNLCSSRTITKSSANYAGVFIINLLEVVDCRDLSKLRGKPVRVEIVDGYIYKIGNFISDKWFCPKEMFNG